MSERITNPKTVLALGLWAIVATGCAGADLSEDRDYRWKATGQSENGCLQYTKQPTEDGVVVDQAIYYRDAQGGYTTDRSECAARTDANNQEAQGNE